MYARNGQDGNAYNIASTPLYYVRSGLVNAYYGTLRYAGVDGYGWSQISHSDVRDAYYLLYFNSSDVNPSHYGRYNAFPAVRRQRWVDARGGCDLAAIVILVD